MKDKELFDPMLNIHNKIKISFGAQLEANLFLSNAKVR